MDIISYQKAKEALEKAIEAMQNSGTNEIEVSETEPTNKNIWYKIEVEE